MERKIKAEEMIKEKFCLNKVYPVREFIAMCRWYMTWVEPALYSEFFIRMRWAEKFSDEVNIAWGVGDDGVARPMVIFDLEVDG